MAEYIEREAAINQIKEYASDVYGIDLDDANQFSGDSLAENYCEGLYEATELIDDMPAADVAPVVHGRWDDSGRYMFPGGGTAVRCTECGCALTVSEYRLNNWNYCPNCGAKMDGGADHDA